MTPEQTETMQLARTAIVGATGFVGNCLRRAFPGSAHYNSANIDTIRGRHFELLICAAPTSLRWWVNKHPANDWANISRLIESLGSAFADRVVHVSTVDAFSRLVAIDEGEWDAGEPAHPYGYHRRRLEEAFEAMFPRVHILRLPNLYGDGLKKNALFDLLNGHETEKVNIASTHQWYRLDRLPRDIAAVIDLDIPRLAPVPEPIRLSEIHKRWFAHCPVVDEAQTAIRNDVRTIHAQALGGSGLYVQAAELVWNELDAFVTSYVPDTS
jgi:hypothetical protein